MVSFWKLRRYHLLGLFMVSFWKLRNLFKKLLSIWRRTIDLYSESLMKKWKEGWILLCIWLLTSLTLIISTKDPTIQYDIEVSEGFIKYVETFYHGEFVKQDLVVNYEISLYNNKSGPFGRLLALKGYEKKDEKFEPGMFWLKIFFTWLIVHFIV